MGSFCGYSKEAINHRKQHAQSTSKGKQKKKNYFLDAGTRREAPRQHKIQAKARRSQGTRTKAAQIEIWNNPKKQKKNLRLR
jgi:hypothetical protein